MNDQEFTGFEANPSALPIPETKKLCLHFFLFRRAGLWECTACGEVKEDSSWVIYFSLLAEGYQAQMETAQKQLKQAEKDQKTLNYLRKIRENYPFMILGAALRTAEEMTDQEQP